MKKIMGFTASVAVVASILLTGCASSTQPASSSVQESSSVASAAASSEVQQAETPKFNYKDGTYTGSARGMGGDVTVTLTVTDGVVTVDDIQGPYETPGVGGKEAMEDGTFKAQIEEAQSGEIDGVAGATMTSGGVKRAVEAALDQAK